MDSAGASDKLLQALACCARNKEMITVIKVTLLQQRGVCPASDASGDTRLTCLSLDDLDSLPV